MNSPTKNKDKQNYQEQVISKLDLLSEQIEKLQAQGADLREDLAIEYNAKMAEMYVKREEIEIKIRELQNASDEAWIEIKTGLDKALQELNTHWNQALSKF